MIQSVNIHNFQSHKDTTLTLDPGLNVVVGATDSGKSSIIRALRWLIWNRPMGDAFRSTWGGDTEVFVQTESAYITRLKGKEGNLYHINDEDLKAFGNDVPEKIQQALNMDEVNLQQQLDRPFLISNSPGEVAAYFNKIAGLYQIDTGVRKVQGQIQALSNTIKSDEARAQQCETELKKYEYIDKFEIELESLESMVSTRNQKVNLLNAIKSAIVNLEEYDAEIQLMEKKCDLLEPVEEVLDMIEQRDLLMQEKVKIDLICTNYTSTDIKVSNLQMELGEMEEAFHKYMPDTCPLCGK